MWSFLSLQTSGCGATRLCLVPRTTIMKLSKSWPSYGNAEHLPAFLHHLLVLYFRGRTAKAVRLQHLDQSPFFTGSAAELYQHLSLSFGGFSTRFQPIFTLLDEKPQKQNQPTAGSRGIQRFGFLPKAISAAG